MTSATLVSLPCLNCTSPPGLMRVKISKGTGTTTRPPCCDVNT
jgi:hypothetical protein